MKTPEPPIRPLETPRLVLEPQVAAHADEMFIVLSDPAIYEFENAPPGSVGSAARAVSRARSAPVARRHGNCGSTGSCA